MKFARFHNNTDKKNLSICVNNAEEMLLKIHFSKKYKEIHLVGYQKRNTQHVLGNRVGEEGENKK